MSEVPVRVPDEWFVGFHQGLAARFWRAAAAAMAEDDMQVVRRLLPDPPASVLDVPCGDGRLTTRLVAAGYAGDGRRPDRVRGRARPPRRGGGRRGGALRRGRPAGAARRRARRRDRQLGQRLRLPRPGGDRPLARGHARRPAARRPARARVDDRRRVVPRRRLQAERRVGVRRHPPVGDEPLPRHREPARERLHVRGRRRATSSTPARRTTSTPAARSCACSSTPGSARSSSWAATASSPTRSARHA